MFQFAQCLCFNLPDAFACHVELLAHFFQCVVRIHADAKAHAQHAFFARGQAGQHACGLFAQIGLDRGINWDDRVLVFNEIA